MITDFGVEPSVAIHLWRSILTNKVKKYDLENATEVEKTTAQTDAEKQMIVNGQGEKTSVHTEHQNIQSGVSSDVEMTDAKPSSSEYTPR
jgi:hypothetical protein